MTQPRAADDFAMIRARMKELRRERERAEAAADSAQERDALTPRGGSTRWPREISAEPSRVRQSGAVRS